MTIEEARKIILGVLDRVDSYGGFVVTLIDMGQVDLPKNDSRYYPEKHRLVVEFEASPKAEESK